MRLRNFLKLFFLVVLLFALIGCDEYDISFEFGGTTTEIQSNETTTDIMITTLETTETTTEDIIETDEGLSTLTYEEQLIMVEELIIEYLRDYSNPELSNEEIIERYFHNGGFEGFNEERNRDLENEMTLEFISIECRIDGAFDITYRAIKGDDQWERKQPGRIIYRSNSDSASIEWIDETSEITELCKDILDKEETLMMFERYFNDYLNAEISNEAFASMYYGGKVDEYLFSQREKDLENDVSITVIDVVDRADDLYFDIIYEVRKGDDQWERKRPGRIRYQDLNQSTLIIWKTDEESNPIES